MYGFSGASGKTEDHTISLHLPSIWNILGSHCCLWCTIPSSKLKIPLQRRGKFPIRTLETLESDYAAFISKGCDPKHACNNVIGEYIFDIPLENVCVCVCERESSTCNRFKQVCVPGLHLSLGIFNRLWTLLEDACTELDLQLAEVGVGDNTGGGSFSQYSAILNERSQLATWLSTQTSQAGAVGNLHGSQSSKPIPKPTTLFYQKRGISGMPTGRSNGNDQNFCIQYAYSTYCCSLPSCLLSMRN